MTDTIFALSSGAPPAGIAVVRISGPRADETLETVAGALPDHRYLSLRTVRDPATGEALDRALVARFAAEHSVTGEPLAELHLHGSRATVDAVENALAGIEGLRRARAGEFTWRAFENGRLDLVQVESLSDLLRAETDSQRRAALAGDGLSVQVDRWREQVLHLSALAEAALDQSDEDDVPADRSQQESLFKSLEDDLRRFLDAPGAERLFDGIRVVFAGPPNAGKSTLINGLAQRDVAIVSATPGTTRDVIEAPVKLGGIAFVLTDTAGLRADSPDAVEREGIDRAQRRLAAADLVVWMDESSNPPDGVTAIRIFPRSDETDRQGRGTDLLRVSARTGEGIGELIERLIDEARSILPREGEVALTRRQRDHLGRCYEAVKYCGSESDELIAAEHLRLARRTLDDLTGRAGTEEMLDALFSTFCIGK